MMANYFLHLINLIFSLEDPLGYTVNMLILALFAVGCLDVLQSLWKLRLERFSVSLARKALKESGPRSRCPSDSENEILSFLRVPAASLLSRRIGRVVRLRSAGLGHRDVLQLLTSEQIGGYGALARYIGMVLTLLGLFGTVFGLSLAVVKAQGALEGMSDLAALRELSNALGGTLRGMKTAFATTLTGLITSILLSYLNHLVRRSQSAALATVEDFVTCDLLPVLESVDPGADEAAVAFANVLTRASEDLNTVRESVAAAAKEQTAAGEMMLKATGALETAVASFGDCVARVVENQSKFTETMGDTRDAVRKMSDAVLKQFKELQNYTTNSNKILEERLSALQEAAKSTKTTHEDLHGLVNGFHDAVKQYHEHFRGTLGESFEEVKASLTQLLSDVNQHFEAYILKHVKQSQQEFEKALEQQRAHLTGLICEHKSALSAFSDMVVDVHHKTGDLFTRIDTGGGNGRDKAPRTA